MYKPCDLEVIEKRLTSDHLTSKTLIFKSAPPVSLAHGLHIAARFEGYWKTWVEQDLKNVFEELRYLRAHVLTSSPIQLEAPKEEPPVDYDMVPLRLFGRVVGVMVRIGEVTFVPIKDGVRIHGPGYSRTIKNCFYDDIYDTTKPMP